MTDETDTRHLRLVSGTPSPSDAAIPEDENPRPKAFSADIAALRAAGKIGPDDMRVMPAQSKTYDIPLATLAGLNLNMLHLLDDIRTNRVPVMLGMRGDSSPEAVRIFNEQAAPITTRLHALVQFAQLVAALDGSVGMSAGAVMELRNLAADHVRKANEL